MRKHIAVHLKCEGTVYIVHKLTRTCVVCCFTYLILSQEGHTYHTSHSIATTKYNLAHLVDCSIYTISKPLAGPSGNAKPDDLAQLWFILVQWFKRTFNKNFTMAD